MITIILIFDVQYVTRIKETLRFLLVMLHKKKSTFKLHYGISFKLFQNISTNLPRDPKYNMITVFGIFYH